MTDFIPKTPEVMHAEVPELIPTSTPAPNPEMQATIKLAEVTADSRVLQLIKVNALWQQVLTTVKKIKTPEEYNNAVELFDKVKKALKAKEEIRHEYVDFPTKFAALVNTMFRPMGEGFEKVKAHLSKVISDYDRREREKVEAERKAAEEAQKKQEAAESPTEEVVESSSGVGILVQMDIPMPPEVPTVHKTPTGARVQMRETLECELTDPIKLLKAIVSVAERNKVYSLDLIEFKMPAIRKLCEGKRKIPGVKWERVRKAV
jgi:uncharacterized membrane-anchored protein YhcB (DUF1043 family)